MYGRYMIGDTNEDDSRFLPFDDDNLVWDSELFTYMPTESLVKNFIGDLKGDYNNFDIFLENQRDIVLEHNYSNPNDPQGRTSEFKVARTRQGRLAFQKMIVAQIRYSDYDGADMDENQKDGKVLSPRARNIGANLYNYIGTMGQVIPVNPDKTDPDGYRNY